MPAAKLALDENGRPVKDQSRVPREKDQSRVPRERKDQSRVPLSVLADEDPNVLKSLRQTHKVAPPEVSVAGSEPSMVAAAFQQENLAVNLVNALTEETPDATEGYDPISELSPSELTNASEFAESRSSAETNQIRQKLQRQQEARDVLAGAPLSTSLPAILLATIVDLDSLVPFGAVAKLRKGKVVAGALTGGLSQGAVEIGLNAQQPDRNQSQILVSALAGGVFGGGIGALMGRGQRAYENTIEEYTEAIASIAPGPGGAAVNPATSLMRAEDTVVSGRVTKLAAEGLRKLGLSKITDIPGISLLASPNTASRQASLELVDNAIYTDGALRGVTAGASIETNIKSYDRFVATGIDIIAQFKPQSPLKARAFREEVGKALRNGDQHADAAVSEAAQGIRKAIFDPLKQAAIKAGLLPEGIETSTALSYFTRVYNRSKIYQNHRGFTQIVRDWLGEQDPDLSGIELDDIATSITNQILGSSFSRVPFLKVPATRGPLKERTFNIPDKLIEDFLVSDIQQVLPAYIRTVSPQIEFARRYPGTKNALDEVLLPRIQDVADAEIKANPADALKIQREADRDKTLVEGLFNRLSNTTGMANGGYGGISFPARGLRVARQFTNTTILGGIVLSSLPDLARPIMEESLGRTMGVAFRGLAGGFKNVRMGTKQAQLMGTALDNRLSTRARSFTEAAEPFSPDVSRFEQRVSQGEELFFTATGINAWNTMLKGVSSTIISTRILETVKRAAGGQATRKEVAKLARAGIGRDQVQLILAQEKNWVRQDGAIFGGIEAWDDPHAVAAFRNAVISDTDKTIITPGAADLPLWVDDKFLSMFAHLKSFAFASTGRVLLSGMQQQNASVLTGVSMMVGLGMASSHLKDMAAGRSTADRTMQQWITEGVDKSGVLGFFVDADDLAAKFSKGAFPGILNTIKGEDTRRFQRTDSLEALVPALSVINRGNRAVQKMIRTGDPSGLDRIIPLNNHFLLQGAIQALDDLPE